MMSATTSPTATTTNNTAVSAASNKDGAINSKNVRPPRGLLRFFAAHRRRRHRHPQGETALTSSSSSASSSASSSTPSLRMTTPPRMAAISEGPPPTPRAMMTPPSSPCPGHNGPLPTDAHERTLLEHEVAVTDPQDSSSLHLLATEAPQGQDVVVTGEETASLQDVPLEGGEPELEETKEQGHEVPHLSSSVSNSLEQLYESMETLAKQQQPTEEDYMRLVSNAPAMPLPGVDKSTVSTSEIKADLQELATIADAEESAISILLHKATMLSVAACGGCGWMFTTATEQKQVEDEKEEESHQDALSGEEIAAVVVVEPFEEYDDEAGFPILLQSPVKDLDVFATSDETETTFVEESSGLEIVLTLPEC